MSDRMVKIESALFDHETALQHGTASDQTRTRRALAEAIVDDSDAAIASLGGDLEATYGGSMDVSADVAASPFRAVLAMLGGVIQRRRQDQLADREAGR